MTHDGPMRRDHLRPEHRLDFVARFQPGDRGNHEVEGLLIRRAVLRRRLRDLVDQLEQEARAGSAQRVGEDQPVEPRRVALDLDRDLVRIRLGDRWFGRRRPCSVALAIRRERGALCGRKVCNRVGLFAEQPIDRKGIRVLRRHGSLLDRPLCARDRVRPWIAQASLRHAPSISAPLSRRCSQPWSARMSMALSAAAFDRNDRSGPFL
ncbi:MAG: hypothetical protein AAGM38_15165 [Pseudomonadota bacterium]